ncbi:MAG: M20/M25/M40 family metallo-hydrolase, partial [Chloroflexi bacterium]
MISIDSFKSDTSEMVSLLKHLAEAESPTTNKAAVDHMGAIVAGEMERLGAHVEIDRQAEAGNNVIARWQGDSSLKNIVLLFHMDTVYPVGTVEHQPVLEKDGALFGSGVLDMKGGIAIFAEAVKKLREAGLMGKRSLAALFTSDEETGSHHSRAQIERLAREA